MICDATHSPGREKEGTVSDSGAAMVRMDSITRMDSMRQWPLMATQKRRSMEELRLSTGEHGLEVGCGTGEEVVAIAREVGSTGRCVGMDLSEAMLDEARRRSKDAALPVEFHRGDIHDIPFADEAFHSARAERVFEHLEDPQRALSELVRVTRHGGRIAISPDFDSVTVDIPDRSLGIKFVHNICDRSPNGWAGRQLFGMFIDIGLSEARCEVFTHLLDATTAMPILESLSAQQEETGVLTSDEVERFRAHLRERRDQNRVFNTTSNFMVAGSKT